MPNNQHPASPRPILKQTELDETCASPSSLLGLSYTLSPRSTPKSVSISTQRELVSPLILGKQKSVEDLDFAHDKPLKKPSVKSLNSFKLSGRLASGQSPGLKPLTSIVDTTTIPEHREEPTTDYSTNQVDRLVTQVSNWIRDERAKRSVQGHRTNVNDENQAPGQSVSADATDLDRLEDILKQTLHLDRLPRRKSTTSLRKRPSIKKLHQRKASTVSSDTDYFDNEFFVPSCDAVLDNSQTLAYTGGASDESDVSSGDELTRVASFKDQDAWSRFKFEIVRLTHTLRLKGWRKVSMDMCGDITVQRLSGALTNAVYVVSPPHDLPPKEQRAADGNVTTRSSNPPPKLLLRIYGPQVEHLIDREVELAILRRLARKRIGPRLLGCFGNGRFEEYYHAQPLTPEDFRNPDTSRQIAKRMRELHEGIDLLEQERDDGAFVWRNWDKWLFRVEQIVLWMDEQIAACPPDYKPTGTDIWKRRGYILGVPWKQFRSAIEKYRAWLYREYGGSKNIKDKLVFAHNDTQYGNILRFVPTGESPLLLPANSHKQLVVIDFEYANANLVGLEFANHFTEWCYNYHDARKPYACSTNKYPTPEEQDRFLRAYVRHRPQFNVSTPKLQAETPPTAGSTTPGDAFRARSTTSISDFFLDARTPGTGPTSQPAHDDAAEQANEDVEVSRLRHETRLWRLANTAQWVAWGIVQAKVPGMPDFSQGPADEKTAIEDQVKEDLHERAEEYRDLARQESSGKEEVEEAEEEFDYLGYAQHRAMFFWGDAIQLGIVKLEDLPEEMREKIKTVSY
ncbi:hypothetical protein LTR78_009079 [Recurvomyces mirabilis]|uniref:Choline kinase N-terminal domain-containing protein n=1 Tax=Recurvomyces mirabilis TaxID=574656 RepID=A0AAE0TNU2_9PEZI|nr:hypothetical protein LTR78_009079 [Recurvomyces mirabilis]KAK5161017.1 hypothetical protein LTS14_000811 [Recurvomyces mirabilis]